MDPDATEPTLGALLAFAPLILALVCLVVVGRDLTRLLRPAWYVLSARYPAAREASLALERSWLRVFPSVRATSRYMVACSLHLEGQLAASLQALGPLASTKLDPNLHYAVLSLEAANLVLAGDAPERARTLLREARALKEQPEDLLFLAHVEHARGEVDAARELVELASAAAPSGRPGTRLRVGRTILIDGGTLKRTMFHALRGLYFIRVGRTEDALRDLGIAAAGPHGNVYADRARALLPPRGVAEDPRSSLAPQAIDDL